MLIREIENTLNIKAKERCRMIFEVGKHYEHSTGKKMHILGKVNSDMYYSPCLVAEDLEGNFIPVGTDEENAVNWNEIDETEWLNELKMRDNL